MTEQGQVWPAYMVLVGAVLTVSALLLVVLADMQLGYWWW